MNRYAQIDKNNIIKGWYDDGHSSIPTPNIKVTEEQYKNAIEKEHNHIANDGTTSKVDVEITKEQKMLVAQNYLFETDWYVIRQADSGKEMPSDIKTKRAEARETISNLEE
tara:strand:- start:2901 stop:3233 length:333 start_codon:yes stop_codon:yes gene_type:complete